MRRPHSTCPTQEPTEAAARGLEIKGIVWFLVITFGITWTVEGVLLMRGVSFERVPPVFLGYLLAGLMWAPTVGAVLTRKVVLRESLRVAEARLHLGDLRPYGIGMILMPVMFVLVYGITVLLGLGHLDLSLSTFLAQMHSMGKAMGPQPPAPVMIGGIVAGSVLVAPFINSIFAFGEEYGWRGFLLPKLLPLGRWPAHVIGGIIWGLWHAPLVLMGFNYPGYPWTGVVWMCVLTTFLGIFENEWTLRYDSILLASFIHGTFNSQVYGIWRVIVPHAHPLLGGFGGLIGLAALTVIAVWAWKDRVTLAASSPDLEMTGRMANRSETRAKKNTWT